MSKAVITEVVPANALEHPAIQAWSQLLPDRVEPESVQVLKRKTKSAVYRLVGVGPGGAAVIAKRCCGTSARIERMIYEELLLQLPVTALRCYGFVEAVDVQYCWLFLEDAGGQMYSPQNPEHRALAGHWLGLVHSNAAKLGLADRLPDRSKRHYKKLLLACRDTARQHLRNPALPSDDVGLLKRLVSYCEVLEVHWTELEEICGRIPPTLVHGDFVLKNVRIRATPSGPALLPFDWEFCGWGVPATDLAQFTGETVSPDLSAYRMGLERSGTPLDALEVQQLAECGKFFRLLDDMYWEVLCLEHRGYEYLARPMSCLKVYEPQVAEALRAARWIW